MRLKATTATYLKRYPIQSSEIIDFDKRLMGTGDEIEVNWHRIEGVHVLVEVTNPIGGRFNWYVFGEHCEVWDGKKQLHPRTPVVAADSILLNVPFWKQTDNLHEPGRSCNSSSCAMIAKFLGAKIKSDDEYYQIVRKYGDTTDHGAQTKALRQLGIKSTWHTNLDFADLDHSLLRGKPIVIGILHRGPESAPRGGHIIVVIGKTGAGDMYVHDPFGSVNDGYTSAVENGNCAIYNRKTLKARWLPDGPSSGWGRLF